MQKKGIENESNETKLHQNSIAKTEGDVLNTKTTRKRFGQESEDEQLPEEDANLQEEREIKAYLDEGHTKVEAADKFNRSRPTIDSRLKLLEERGE